VLVFWFEQGTRERKGGGDSRPSGEQDVALVLPRRSGATRKPGSATPPASTSGIDALRSMVQEYFGAHMERLIVSADAIGGTEEAAWRSGADARTTKHQLVKFDAENRRRH